MLNFRTFRLIPLLAWLIFLPLAQTSSAELDPSAWYIENNWVDGPGLLGDSGVTFPTWASIESEMKTLQDLYPEQATSVKYGRTPQGRDLQLIKIQSSNPESSKKSSFAVEISGAIHGNEFLGIEHKLARVFLERQNSLPGLAHFLMKGGAIYIIPVVNPDGFESRRRGNSRGVDLNRDFDILPTQTKKFIEPETSALARYLDQDLALGSLELKAAVDYHCCVPAFITPWTYTNLHPSPEDLGQFQEISDLQTQTLGFEVGNATDTVGYLALGTSVDYFYAKYKTLAFTIEGRYRGENNDFEKHIQFFDQLFENLAQKMTF